MHARNLYLSLPRFLVLIIEIQNDNEETVWEMLLSLNDNILTSSLSKEPWIVAVNRHNDLSCLIISHDSIRRNQFCLARSQRGTFTLWLHFLRHLRVFNYRLSTSKFTSTFCESIVGRSQAARNRGVDGATRISGDLRLSLVGSVVF